MFSRKFINIIFFLDLDSCKSKSGMLKVQKKIIFDKNLIYIYFLILIQCETKFILENPYTT